MWWSCGDVRQSLLGNTCFVPKKWEWLRVKSSRVPYRRKGCVLKHDTVLRKEEDTCVLVGGFLTDCDVMKENYNQNNAGCLQDAQKTRSDLSALRFRRDHCSLEWIPGRVEGEISERICLKLRNYNSIINPHSGLSPIVAHSSPLPPHIPYHTPSNNAGSPKSHPQGWNLSDWMWQRKNPLCSRSGDKASSTRAPAQFTYEQMQDNF